MMYDLMGNQLSDSGPVRDGLYDIGGAPISTGGDAPRYEGAYNVTPGIYEDVVLQTEGKYLSGDVQVEKIPQYEVTNTEGGYTLIIGKESL